MSLTNVSHPYYPRDLDLPHYVASTMPLEKILAIFFGMVALVTLAANAAIGTRKNISHMEKFTFIWFIISGTIHIVMEGYFSWNHSNIAGNQFVIAQLWKEYAKSDSRYLSSDMFIVVMEFITAHFDGPACYLAAYALYKNLPYHHIVQLVVSVCHIYGDVLYYATSILEGSPHCTPHPYYFYFYFIFLNSFWIVIPLVLAIQSCCKLHEAMSFFLKTQHHQKSK
ncbi:uncharacterized protein VTP21DRAFT_9631 [Calcarisporiella thermophila]|uniref:uncharacterized protein n=1 Tax=Calcarisporiella thermophila TaxID=911321 RepID=UPI0037428BD0